MAHIERERAKLITDEIREAIQSVLDKHKLTTVQATGKYGHQYQFTVKAVDVTEPVSTSEDSSSQLRVNNGLAVAGQKCWAYDSTAKEWLPIRILESRRSKYTFEWWDFPEDGRFNIPFRGVSVNDPGAPIENPFKDGTEESRKFQALHEVAYRQHLNPQKSLCAYIDLMYFGSKRSIKEVTNRLKAFNVLDKNSSFNTEHSLYSHVMQYVESVYV